MSNFFNIIFIPSDDKPAREFQLKKIWVYTFLAVPLIMAVSGFYLLLAGALSESPSETGHRKNIARKNLKLTQRILSLEESHKKYSRQLSELEKKARETMAAASVDLNIKGSDSEAEFTGSRPGTERIHAVEQLVAKARELNIFFDNILSIINRNSAQIEFLPVLPPVSLNSFIIRDFGKVKDPFTGRQSYHTGIDFSGQPGDPVFAPGSGVIKSISKDSFYGQTIRLRHNKQTESFFAHLQSIKVKKGQKIKRGEIIATLGSSGKSTGPHLHFEILVLGEKINPANLYLPELEYPFDSYQD